MSTPILHSKHSLSLVLYLVCYCHEGHGCGAGRVFQEDISASLTAEGQALCMHSKCTPVLTYTTHTHTHTHTKLTMGVHAHNPPPPTYTHKQTNTLQTHTHRVQWYLTKERQFILGTQPFSSSTRKQIMPLLCVVNADSVTLTV